jgi:hypothetical protein
VTHVKPEQAFIVTVGVPSRNTRTHCKRALLALQHAGFVAAPTSDEAVRALAERIESEDER